MNADNPYAVPNQLPKHDSSANSPPTKLPMYSVIMLIVDLCFRFLRLLLVSFSILGVVAMGSDAPLYFWGILEVVTGVGMVVCGLLGDALVLAKKRIGIPICWAAIVATIGNLVVGLCELPIMMSQQLAQAQPGQEDALKIGMLIGGVLIASIRFAIIAAYAVAVVMAAKALRPKALPDRNPFANASL